MDGFADTIRRAGIAIILSGGAIAIVIAIVIFGVVVLIKGIVRLFHASNRRPK